MTQTIYYGEVAFQSDALLLGATTNGLAFIGSPNQGVAELMERFPKANLVAKQEQVAIYEEALQAYFSGQQPSFDLPLDVLGTDFQKAVWKRLKDVPYGQTVSYSALAEALNKPKAARAIGKAVGSNPLLILIPCHRVIGKTGKLTGYRAGLEMKRSLLTLEGISWHE